MGIFHMGLAKGEKSRYVSPTMQELLRQNLLRVATAYAAFKGLSLRQLGSILGDDVRLFERLADPKKSFTIRKYDEWMAWFSMKWPDEAVWPEGIDRPAADASETERVA
jgi:hypothetical protein